MFWLRGFSLCDRFRVCKRISVLRGAKSDAQTILPILAHGGQWGPPSAQGTSESMRMASIASRTPRSYVYSNTAVYHWTRGKNRISGPQSTDPKRESPLSKWSPRNPSSRLGTAVSLWSTNRGSSNSSPLYILTVGSSTEERRSLTSNTPSSYPKEK